MINFNIYNKRHSTKASRRRERSWITLEALLSPSLDIFRALALIGPLDHHHRLPLDLLPVFFQASSYFLWTSSSFLLALIYRVSAWLSFLTC
jgi:hypothetical protein